MPSTLQKAVQFPETREQCIYNWVTSATGASAAAEGRWTNAAGSQPAAAYGAAAAVLWIGVGGLI